MPTTTRTYQIFTAIDNPVPVLIFQVPNSTQAQKLELAIREADWWSDPANPATMWHLSGVARYDIATTTTSSMTTATTTATKKLVLAVGGTSQTHLIPSDQVDAVDAAAKAGGFSLLPNGFRVNWDLVSTYLFT